jgi:hypothetical protein
MSEHLIKTIHKVRVAGRYVEFWFKEDLRVVESYHSEWERFSIQEGFHACIKTYDFLDILQQEGIYSDVLTDGLKYRKMLWKRSHYETHLEFVSFLNDTRIVLIEKVK